MKRVGFSGTRKGMTVQQKRAVRALLRKLRPEEAHHGDCIESDEQFHEICRGAGLRIVGHPPTNMKQRAFCIFDLLLPEKPYLTRNKNIVDATQALIATPSELTEPKPARGQGTWSTVRYARRAAHNPSVYVVWPSGKVTA